MNFRQAITPYIDEHGLVQNRTDGHRGITSGNGWVYTCNAILVLHTLGQLKDVDALEMRLVFNRCWKRDQDGQPIVGLLTRAPGHPKQESQEDYIAAFTICKVLGLHDIAEAMHRARRTHYLVCTYVYNNEDPGTFSGSAWLGRFKPFIAHQYHCLGKYPPLLHRWRWCEELKASGDTQRTATSKPKEDERILAWFKAAVAPEGSDYHSAIEHWKNELHAVYPGGIPQVWREHLNDTRHPFGHVEVMGWE